MPNPIALAQTPNQSFTVVLDDQRYLLALRTIPNGTTLLDVTVNDVAIIAGVRLVPNRLAIPYAYLEGAGGNFLLNTDGETLADWTLFGVTQQLLYFTAAEMLTLRRSLL